MAGLFSDGRAPAEVMEWMAAEDRKRDVYAPCTCGSDRKFRFCHGARDEAATSAVATREA
jgi:uncharacterized protein